MRTAINLPKIAYFSMEIALDPDMPTYSGGLGVLAGDTLRSAADLGVPITGVTLLHRKGYFRQHLDPAGNQSEEPQYWQPEEVLEPVEGRGTVMIEGRRVVVRAWRYTITGVRGDIVPVYLLDTDLPENSEWDRRLTDSLYGGDDHYRLCQEAVLGMGGVSFLNTLGPEAVEGYHMNEGHSALLTLALLEARLTRRSATAIDQSDIESVRSKCIFTTHTPVPAGHDQFSQSLAEHVLGNEKANLLHEAGCWHGSMLNMTHLALHFSRYINGVAMRHGEVSRGMFPRYPISAITNGVHAATWTSEPFQQVYDKYIPDWRADNNYLRYAISIPFEEIRRAHATSKGMLLEEVQKHTGVQLDPSILTLGFARRASTYKRADLLFHDPERLKWIADNIGPMQIVYGGKAHPRDDGGKALIRRVFDASRSLSSAIRVVYVENYDMHWGKLMTSGVDVWLNTPMRPQEASGTSGMKAALNGVPSFSVVDGWWLEGHIEGVTGWSIGNGDVTENAASEVMNMYDKLERVILPMFYGRPYAFAKVMRSAIALNGAFFNTQRMVLQYVGNAYLQRAQSIARKQARMAQEQSLVQAK
ncbi:MAG TPA: alpha-glucan family phosphorylase [Terriglobales bacterium]|nr:alpha-glucan family phosphorylase [Terriglobales bacterium]